MADDSPERRPTLNQGTRWSISIGVAYILWLLTNEQLGLAAVTLGVIAGAIVNAVLKAWRSPPRS